MNFSAVNVNMPLLFYCPNYENKYRKHLSSG
jgi:hypothetical protein